MIKPTDAMNDAWANAYVVARTRGAEIPVAEREALIAVLAIVERDYDVTPKQSTGPGQCGEAGPDGLRCGRPSGHRGLRPILDEQAQHAAYADESGELVRW